MLRAGLTVAFPTETVYGLGADACSPQAVAGIFEAKQRPHFDPLIVHVSDTAAARALVTEFPPVAEQLADRFWPGPLTLVLPRTSVIPDLVTAGLPGVGLRVPHHNVAQQLLSAAGCPVAAPSANPFGGISPTTADHVMDGLDGRIDAVVEGGSCGVGLESTVVSLMNDRPLLLRPGGLPAELLESLIGPLDRASSDPAKDDAAQPAPGMLSRHYAPQTKLRLIGADETAEAVADQRCGLLTYGERPLRGNFERIERLSPVDDLRTCAINFFAAMRSLDAARLDVIIARRFPDRNLGTALNDRLRRAAS